MLYVALLWHHHQPVYKDPSHPTPAGSHRQPWVRLHAIRDYYAMANLVAGHPGLHLTINLTPTLIWQIEDQVERGATDRARELTTKPAEDLDAADQEEILSTFFDADWHNQIFPHSRYKELFARRQQSQPFSIQDLRDLQMWFNLAWFGKEFRDGDVSLVTGEVASVRRYVEQGRNYRVHDVQLMLAEQDKILRAVIPLHRQLQDRGQIEVSTTPFAHPILPMLIDSDLATIDRPGGAHPLRFHHPEDAERQLQLATDCYRRHFGRHPAGMWPAEGAVSQSSIPIFARHGIRWIATDGAVLARSGRWGYEADNPDVLCQPYRAEEDDSTVSIFFRDARLSDEIGFRYHAYDDLTQAAREFVHEIKERFAWLITGDDRVLTIVLDGENAWGSYREDARPFLHALYGLLETDPDLTSVTFGEYLDGNPARGIAPHPFESLTKVYDLFTGSWIDENGSTPGVDLGTWVGEPEENRAWALLETARSTLRNTRVTPETAPGAFNSLMIAEGSDWFWWLGEDHDSGRDDEFDDLFRMHLKNVYREIGVVPPVDLDWHIVPHAVVWTVTDKMVNLQSGDRLRVRTNCPGVLTWWLDNGQVHESALLPVGGVMASTGRHQLTLDPLPPETRIVNLRFRCTEPGCLGNDICCLPCDPVNASGATPRAGEQQAAKGLLVIDQLSVRRHRKREKNSPHVARAANEACKCGADSLSARCTDSTQRGAESRRG